MKKNNTAEKTVLDAQKIAKALKEGTEKSLQNIVKEAIDNMIANSDNENEEDEDSYEVEDVDTEKQSETSDENLGSNEETPAAEEGGENADADEESAENADEWADMEDYKVNDDVYDFTGVDGDEVLKVYNKLGDDDQIFVKKEDDGTYSVKDDETGAEFVIELNPEGEGAAESNDEFGSEDASIDGEENGETTFDLNLDLGDEEGEGEESFDNTNAENGEEFGGEDTKNVEDDDEIEINLNDGDEEENLNEENLGYTDSYQKDVFAKKFNMKEPADKKTTYTMDDGAPDGANKPWAGKGDNKPFGKNAVDECGTATPVAPDQEANLEENGSGKNSKRRMTKGMTGINNQGEGYHEESKAKLDESVAKIVAKAKEIQAENKQYKAAINDIKKSLYEAAVLNVNLGKLVDILVNETTTKDEKKSICERFNNVKTIAEGKSLYTTIKTELNEAKKSAPILEKQLSADSTKTLNETTIYMNAENSPAMDLMNRMENLFKK